MDYNALGTDEGLFEVIGKISSVSEAGSLDMKPGLEKVVHSLATDHDPMEKGASFTLFMAREVASGDYSRVAAFEVERATGNRLRRIDMIERCDQCPAGVTEILHENENWTTALDGPSDGRLVALADEFKRDILLHAASNFGGYRLNLRTTVQHQADIIKNALLRQFDDDFVKTFLLDEDREVARDAFEAAFDQGRIVRYLAP